MNARVRPGVLAFIAIAILAGLAAWMQDLTLTAFSAAYFAVALSPWLLRNDTRDTDVFRPYVGLLALTYLYALSTPLYVADAGITFFGEAVDAADLNTYLIACLLAVSGLALGTFTASSGSMLSSKRRGLHRSNSAALLKDDRQWLVSIALALGIAASPFIVSKFNPLAATSYVEQALSLRVERLADNAAGLKETFLETIPSILVLCAATAVFFDPRKQKIWRGLAALVLAGYLTTTLLSGWRGQLMVALLLVTVYAHYRIRQIRWSRVILGGVLVYVLINVLSVARLSTNPAEIFELVTSEIGSRGLQFFAIQQSGELATGTNLLRLISGIRLGESSFGYGEIALGQLAAFLPRALYPDRPEIASELFVKVFYPGIFESGGGYGFFMVQDGYWDFGLFGVFAYCLAFGWAVEKLYRRISAGFQSDLMIFLYALLYSQLVLSMVRSGIFASLKAAAIASLPIVTALVIGWLIANRRQSPHKEMGCP